MGEWVQMYFQMRVYEMICGGALSLIVLLIVFGLFMKDIGIPLIKETIKSIRK